MFWNHLEFRTIPIGEIKANKKSARIHNRSQKRKLQRSLKKFNQTTPIICDQNLVVVNGQAILDGLQALGFTEALVVILKNYSPGDIRALRLALNRIPEDAGWDNKLLQAEFQELLEIGYDLTLTGFDQVEIDIALSFDLPAAGGVEIPPQIPNSVGPPITRIGDLWLLGAHRIFCGDCRNRDVVDLLFGAGLADLIFTDPPYNLGKEGYVSNKGRNRHREFAMASGEMSRQQFIEFLREFLEQAIARLKDGGILYIFIDWRHVLELQSAAEAVGLKLMNICVWTKTNAGMGTFYRSQHEFVCVFKWGDAPHVNTFELGNKGRSRSNVWRYAGMNVLGAERDALLALHPTVKPVALVADAIKDVSHRNHIVFDPFLGSGTTLIAAEETGRRCFGIEIDPLYVDTAIRRWQAATGHQAINATTGESFDDHGPAVLGLEESPRLLPPPSAAPSDDEEG